MGEKQKFKPKSSPHTKGRIGRTEVTEGTEEIKRHLVEATVASRLCGGLGRANETVS